MEGENRLRGDPERNEIDALRQFRLSFWAEACLGERRGNASRPPLTPRLRRLGLFRFARDRYRYGAETRLRGSGRGLSPE